MVALKWSGKSIQSPVNRDEAWRKRYPAGRAGGAPGGARLVTSCWWGQGGGGRGLERGDGGVEVCSRVGVVWVAGGYIIAANT